MRLDKFSISTSEIPRGTSLEKGMLSSDKNVFLPSIKLSQNIRKAIEKNVGCEEELIKTLQDVDLKKRASLNEITLKKDAFLKQQRRRRESLPDVLSRDISNQKLMFARKARDDLECSKMLPSYKSMMWRPGKLPSLPGIKNESDEKQKDSPTLSDSQEITGIKEGRKQLGESDSLQGNSDGKDSGDKASKVHSWPPNPSNDFRKPILRRKSVADVDQAKSVDPTGHPAWLRRQTLHHTFQSSPAKLQTSGTKTNQSICDPWPFVMTLGDITISRYRKVLNRRRSLQASGSMQID